MTPLKWPMLGTQKLRHPKLEATFEKLAISDLPPIIQEISDKDRHNFLSPSPRTTLMCQYPSSSFISEDGRYSGKTGFTIHAKSGIEKTGSKKNSWVQNYHINSNTKTEICCFHGTKSSDRNMPL